MAKLAQRNEQIAATARARRQQRPRLVAENSVFWVACYLAILKLGAVATFRCVCPPSRSTPRWHYGQRQGVLMAANGAASPAALPAEYTLLVDQQPPSLSREVVLPGDDAPVPTCPVVARDDMAALMFTSGSTGQQRQGEPPSSPPTPTRSSNILNSRRQTASWRSCRSNTASGASLLHTHLRVGGSLVLRTPFTYLKEDLLESSLTSRHTGIAGVPSSYQHRRAAPAPNRRFPHLRYVQQAGGRLPDAFIREFLTSQPNAVLPDVRADRGDRAPVVPPAGTPRRQARLTGRGIPGVRLSVLDADGSPGQTR
ncbi:MAG: hypothetical protein U0703_15810 [Anaerolineae bacterium]